MLTQVDDQDRIRREKEEWSGPIQPQIEVVTALLMVTGLITLISLVGWIFAR